MIYVNKSAAFAKYHKTSENMHIIIMKSNGTDKEHTQGPNNKPKLGP